MAGPKNDRTRFLLRSKSIARRAHRFSVPVSRGKPPDSRHRQPRAKTQEQRTHTHTHERGEPQNIRQRLRELRHGARASTLPRPALTGTPTRCRRQRGRCWAHCSLLPLAVGRRSPGSADLRLFFLPFFSFRCGDVESGLYSGVTDAQSHITQPNQSRLT
jgi:hypothetical protein